jgi:hypothetical protein
MRTTVTLSKDVAAAVRRVQREEGVGVSEAVNRLARRGLTQRQERPRYVQPTGDLGLRIDISNIQEALDILDGPNRR